MCDVVQLFHAASPEHDACSMLLSAYFDRLFVRDLSYILNPTRLDLLDFGQPAELCYGIAYLHSHKILCVRPPLDQRARLASQGSGMLNSSVWLSRSFRETEVYGRGSLE